MITPGFQLTARHVIHAVGPIWTDGQRGEQEQLKSAYDRAFEVALAQGTIRSIAFPAISTGAYGFPPSLAAMIAMSAMRRHEPQFDRIIACAFNADTEMLYRNALDATPVTPG